METKSVECSILVVDSQQPFMAGATWSFLIEEAAPMMSGLRANQCRTRVKKAMLSRKERFWEYQLAK